MVEIPEAKKCCFCLPLRRGLLAWVYFKLAIVIGVLCFLVLLFLLLLNYNEPKILLALLIFVQVMLAVEIIFDIMFIISAHNKKLVYLRIYYRYQLATLVNDLIVLVLYIVNVVITFEQEVFMLGFFVGMAFLILGLIALHVYFIYLVRSEVRKLQLTTQFQFNNLADEPECSAQIL